MISAIFITTGTKMPEILSAIFATGAFTDVAKEKEHGSDLYGNNSIGFGSNIKNDDNEDINVKLSTEQFEH